MIAVLALQGAARVVQARADVAGELLAVGGQGDDPVRACAQQRGAGGVFELVDLAVQGGALDADLAGNGKVPADRPLAPSGAGAGVSVLADAACQW